MIMMKIEHVIIITYFMAVAIVAVTITEFDIKINIYHKLPSYNLVEVTSVDGSVSQSSRSKINMLTSLHPPFVMPPVQMKLHWLGGRASSRSFCYRVMKYCHAFDVSNKLMHVFYG